MRVSERLCECTFELVSGWVSKCTSERVSEWLYVWLSEWVYEWVSECVREWVSDWVRVWVSESSSKRECEWGRVSGSEWLTESVSEWVRVWVREWVRVWASEWVYVWEWLSESVSEWVEYWWSSRKYYVRIQIWFESMWHDIHLQRVNCFTVKQCWVIDRIDRNIIKFNWRMLCAGLDWSRCCYLRIREIERRPPVDMRGRLQGCV